MLREANYIELNVDGKVISAQANLNIDDIISEIMAYTEVVKRSTGKSPNHIFIGMDIMGRLCGQDLAEYFGHSTKNTIAGMNITVLPYLKGALPVFIEDKTS